LSASQSSAAGEAAVRCAAELKPDIAIVDLMMPKMNGADATAAMLADNPGIGVVILSSFHGKAVGDSHFRHSRAVQQGHRP